MHTGQAKSHQHGTNLQLNGLRAAWRCMTPTPLAPSFLAPALSLLPLLLLVLGPSEAAASYFVTPHTESTAMEQAYKIHTKLGIFYQFHYTPPS